MAAPMSLAVAAAAEVVDAGPAAASRRQPIPAEVAQLLRRWLEPLSPAASSSVTSPPLKRPVAAALLLLALLAPWVQPCAGDSVGGGDVSATRRPTPGFSAAALPPPSAQSLARTNSSPEAVTLTTAAGGTTVAPIDTSVSSPAGQQLSSPVFLEQPSEAEYYIRTTKSNYTISCRAYAVDMDVRCAGENLPRQLLRLQRLPDPAGNSRQTVVRVEANITRSMVLSYFGDYTCECVAHQDLLGGRRVTSSRVRVHVAYLNKIFYHEPLSTSIGYLHEVELKCQAPEGQPQPTIYWLKDGKEIVPQQDLNFIITNEGSLIIKQARVDDEGNYTCGARNSLGMTRFTDPATVTVNVDGGWTPWSPWSTCDSVCGPSLQQRTRECRLPPARNAGRPCEGSNLQTNPCNNACTVAGAWGEWTTWSTCKTDCQRYRTRKCDSPSPQNGGANCDGLDLENTNCTDGCIIGHEDDLKPQESLIVTTGDKDPVQSIVLYVSLCGAIAVFVVSLVVVVLCVMRRLSRQQQRRRRQGDGFADGTSNLADQASDASLPSGPEKPWLSNGGSTSQPDVTKPSAFVDRYAGRWHHSVAASSPASGRMNGGDYAESMPMLGWEQQQQQQRDDYSAPLPLLSSSAAPPHPPPEYACSPIVMGSLIQNDLSGSDRAAGRRAATPLATTEPSSSACGCRKGNNCGCSRDCRAASAAAAAAHLPQACQLRTPASVTAEPDVIAIGCCGTCSGSNSGSSCSSSGIGSLTSAAGCSSGSFGGSTSSSSSSCSSAQAVVSSSGARLVVGASGIGLVVPDGAVAAGRSVEFFIACSRDDKDRPPLLDKQTLLSPVVTCGPQEATVYQKPLIVSFDHCADVDRGQWKLSLYCAAASPHAEEAPRWERLVTANQEVHNPPACCHIEADRCHAVVDRLAARYCLIGESVFGERAVKRMKLAAFARPCSTASAAGGIGSRSHLVLPREHTVRVYVLPDTMDALQSVIQMEAQLGARMVDGPRQLFFQDGGNNLCILIDGLAAGWTSKQSGNYQEIPFSHIWNSSQNCLHCSFTFESPSVVVGQQQPFSCRLQLYQKSLPTNRQMLLISGDAEASTVLPSANGAMVAQATQWQQPYCHQPECGLMRDEVQQHQQHPRTAGVPTLPSSLSLLSSSSSSSSSGCSSMAGAEGALTPVSLLQHQLPPTHVKACELSHQQQQQQQSGILRLQPRIKQLICAQLDSLSAHGNDWRRLAPLLLGSDRQLSYFASRRSPTELILNLWESSAAPGDRGGASVANLTKALRFMGLEDMALIVDDEASKLWSS